MPPVPLYQEINESRLPGLGVVNILFWDCERHWIRLSLRENLQELVSSIGFLKKTNARRVEGGDLFFHHPSSLPRLPGELQFCLPVVSADDPPRLWVALVGSHDSCLVHVSVCFYNLVWIDGWMFCWEQTMTWGTEDWDIGIFANVLSFYISSMIPKRPNSFLPCKRSPENPPLFFDRRSSAGRCNCRSRIPGEMRPWICCRLGWSSPTHHRNEVQIRIIHLAMELIYVYVTMWSKNWVALFFF